MIRQFGLVQSIVAPAITKITPQYECTLPLQHLRDAYTRGQPADLQIVVSDCASDAAKKQLAGALTDAGAPLFLVAAQHSEQQTQQIQLIRETADSYLVSLDGATSISIDKDLVKAVIHHQTSGWEIRSSIFD